MPSSLEQLSSVVIALPPLDDNLCDSGQSLVRHRRRTVDG